MKHLLMTFAVLSATAAFAERQPYERYQSIVVRQMFGTPPPGFDPTRPPSEVSKSDERAEAEQLTKEQEQIKSAIHFSVINVTPSGDTAVGFTDNSDSKNPIHYYLKVGESRNGWLVKEADPVKATMMIAKGDVEVSLSIGGNSASQAGATAKSNQPSAKLAHGSRMAASNESLRGRRLRLEQQRQEKAAEEAKQRAEEKAQREAEREEEKAQREAEREEQRAQLMQIQEELRKAREARAAREAEQSSDGEGGAEE